MVATPFAIGFEHLIADENQFLFDRALRALGDEATGLPVYGVGHSMGALMHMIIGSRYALPDRVANVLISFNNKPATDAVPLFTPVVAPGLQNLSPLIASVADSPFREPLRGAEAQLRAQAPEAVRELLPVLDQIEPVFREVADGAAEFVPKPEDTKSLIRRYYGVRKNLLLRFTDDAIDETSALAATLTDSSAIKETLDLSVRSLAGDHVRPLRQETPALDVPPELAEPLAQTGDAISGFADALGIAPDENNPLNPLGALRFGFEQAGRGAEEHTSGRGARRGRGGGGDARARRHERGEARARRRDCGVDGAAPGGAAGGGAREGRGGEGRGDAHGRVGVGVARQHRDVARGSVVKRDARVMIDALSVRRRAPRLLVATCLQTFFYARKTTSFATFADRVGRCDAFGGGSRPSRWCARRGFAAAWVCWWSSGRWTRPRMRLGSRTARMCSGATRGAARATRC